MSKIAIISDTHDQIANLRAVMAWCNENRVDTVLHCGDLISPFMLDELEQFTGEIHLIYGNNVGDQHLVSSRCATAASRIRHHGIRGSIKAEGLSIAFVHYPDVAHALAKSQEFDVVCFGHNHLYEVSRVDRTLLINPGHLLGKDGPPGFALLDAVDLSVTRLQAGMAMNDYDVAVTLV